jgi:UDP-4-amino-4,6-dideoxy-N-acetyl-beta-L-altrosamine transaminase
MIPYGRQYIDEDDIAAVDEVLASDWLTTGPKVPQFEQALSRYVGSRHMVAVNSGTSALDIAVQALNLPCGSEVITTPFTFAATANAILYNGLIPVFADIEEGSRNIDPADIERKITRKTRAIISMDYAGHPADMDRIRAIAGDHDLALIEDACHALGASCRRGKIGSLAPMTIFSFHPVKAITTGEGGAVATDDPGLAARLRLLRSHGIDRDATARSGPSAGYQYDMTVLGRNYRMTDISAALGISQLKKLDWFIERRTTIARLYAQELEGVPQIVLPAVGEGLVHAWHIYTVLLDGIDRDWFFSRMREEGIGVNVHYIPIYRFSYYRSRFALSPDAFPVTERVFRRIVSLPIYPRMQDGDVVRVCATLRKVVEQSWSSGRR